MSNCANSLEITNVFGERIGELLMEFPKNIRSLLETDDGRLFVTLDDGTVIDCTELVGEAKH